MVNKAVKDLRKRLSAKDKQIDKHKKEAVATKKAISEHKERNEELRAERKNLRKTIQKHTDTYVIETKKALSTAILAAFAFLMALSWREYIIEAVDSILSYNPVQSKLISALFVTIICVIGIIVATRLLSVKEN